MTSQNKTKQDTNGQTERCLFNSDRQCNYFYNAVSPFGSQLAVPTSFALRPYGSFLCIDIFVYLMPIPHASSTSPADLGGKRLPYALLLDPVMAESPFQYS